MANQMKPARNSGQTQRSKFVVLVIGCFVVSMTFILVSRPQSLPFAYVTSKTSNNKPSEPATSGDSSATSQVTTIITGERNNEDKANQVDLMEETTSDPIIPQEKPKKDETFVDKDEPDKEVTSIKEEEQDETQKRLALPTVSNYTIKEEKEETSQSEKQALPQLGGEMKNLRYPLCDLSDPRFDICDMTGDVRIAGNSSAITFAESADQLNQESWQLHPYPRKGDGYCLSRVREFTVKSSSDAPECIVRHNVPAVFFSIGGYSGNFFHDFTDLLIPLYLTARRYDGEVQLVVSDYNPYWIYKYLLFFQKLSKYPVINYEKDKDVHCFKHVVIGLQSHKELSIDPGRAPNGYSMVTFTKFMREAYSLERETITNIEDLQARRPKLLLIQRKLSRTFTNIKELIQMGDDVGFEVVVDDVEGADMAKFAKLVNSVDVLVGVHGSALTGMVFLPPNATVIQVVPWGALEELAMYNFGTPAKDMKLNYLQYSINMEESTLIEQYSRDHEVFKDPKKIHKEGYGALASTFLKNQNVKIDLNRFKGVLWKALEHAFI